MAPLRVVHIVRQFSPSVGGLEDAVLSLARAQRNRLNMDASVVTLDRVFGAPDRLPAREVVDGVPVRRLPWMGSTRYPLAPSVLQHLRADAVVHVHAIDFFFDFLALTRPLHRRRMIATTHGGFFHTGAYSAAKKLWFRSITRASIQAYAQIVACSYSDAEMFGPAAGKRLTLIENGINQGKFGGAAAKTPHKTILSFGRFARHKRLDQLFKLFAALHANDSAWRLIVAGREADQKLPELTGLASQLGVSEAIRFVINPSDVELRALMGEASFFGCLSSYEGFGLAAVEAMSAGLIPILSSIPVFKRLVSPHGGGVLIDTDDIQGGARMICALQLADQTAYGEWRARVMKVAARYDWEEVAVRYGMLYEDAAGQGGVVRQLLSSGIAH